MITHEQRQQEPNERRKRIVLAEDDRSLRDVLVSILEDEGYVVAQMEDGRQLAEVLSAGIGAFQSKPAFDLVISDVRMPGLSGLEVLRTFRRVDSKTPFILITAFGSHDLHRDAGRSGATAHLDKPFDLDDLMMMVKLLVPNHSSSEGRKMARLLDERRRPDRAMEG